MISGGGRVKLSVAVALSGGGEIIFAIWYFGRGVKIIRSKKSPARRGKRDRPARQNFEFNLERELLTLREELRTHAYRPGAFATHLDLSS